MDSSAQFELFGHIMLALVLGSLVGLQREFRGHEAGIRTTALVCTGAAIFGEVSEVYGDSRIAAGVVQGVGFLGAGLIFRQGEAIVNLTTASTIWLVAGIGLLVSQELLLLAVCVSVAVMVLLELAPLSNWVFEKGGGELASKQYPGADEEPGVEDTGAFPPSERM